MSNPRRAVIIVDVQNEYFEGPLEIQYPPREESLTKIHQVLDAAEAEGLPIALIEHEYPDGFPVFAPGTKAQESHPEIKERATANWATFTKSYSSVFPGTGVQDWLASHEVDTITLVGYMTNNCILATSVDAEPKGLQVEVLSDATGAINLGNAAGQAPAQQVHETLMTLLNSNFATVATTEAWASAVQAKEALPGSNLIESAGN
ncbi:isochorismatase family protein [Corynebacterium lubricantis]|uniref:isochorismatase family protein n=1 Tax=Corynebacterium lubricantis TaxID=541095 RepID=UPI00035E1721|nr:isochorismatase family protein [Corynebacterium lubricantis]